MSRGTNDTAKHKEKMKRSVANEGEPYLQKNL